MDKKALLAKISDMSVEEAQNSFVANGKIFTTRLEALRERYKDLELKKIKKVRNYAIIKGGETVFEFTEKNFEEKELEFYERQNEKYADQLMSCEEFYLEYSPMPKIKSLAIEIISLERKQQELMKKMHGIEEELKEIKKESFEKENALITLFREVR